MASDESRNCTETIIASFSAEEQQSFLREIDRRLGKFVGRRLSKTVEAKIVAVIVEEVEMILVARDA
jgi:hypothetical protein